MSRPHCDRCHRQLRGHYVYSRTTGNRYCADLQACAKRARKIDRASLADTPVAAQAGPDRSTA